MASNTSPDPVSVTYLQKWSSGMHRSIITPAPTPAPINREGRWKPVQSQRRANKWVVKQAPQFLLCTKNPSYLAMWELGTTRFLFQKDDSETIGFKVPNCHWFELCQPFLSCILLNLTTWIYIFFFNYIRREHWTEQGYVNNDILTKIQIEPYSSKLLNG